MIFQLSALVLTIEIVDEPLAVLWIMEAHSMKRLLKMDGIVLVPNGGPSGIAAFADQYVSFDGSVLGGLVRKKPHFEKIRKIEGEPADIEIAQVLLRLPLVLCLVVTVQLLLRREG
jgi:hypothetical protein